MKVFLNGGGSIPQTIETYKVINEVIDHKKRVLYVPLAMDPEIHPYDECFKWIKEEISILEVSGIEMVKTFDELASIDYNNYSMIFFGGGNTYKLLKGIKDHNCFNKLKEYINNGGIFYGASAGSVICGFDIDVISVMDENNVLLKDTKGLDLLNGLSLFVHYTNYKTKLTKEENETLHEKYTNFLIKYSKTKRKVIAIPEEDTIFINDNTTKVIGNKPYYIFENGKIEKIDIE